MVSKKLALPVFKLPTSWSFSRWSDYETCPRKFALKHLAKVSEPASPAMERGRVTGEACEAYVKGTIGATVPPELRVFAAEFRALRKMYKKKAPNGMVVEDTWAFTKVWGETTWNDWVGCWLRVKVDCAHHLDGTTLMVTDWKTGKYRPEEVAKYAIQLELYALGALLLFPHLEAVKVRLGFLDAGVFHPAAGDEVTYTKADVPGLKKLWLKRVAAMFADRVFAPRPNRFCSSCWYRKSNTSVRGGAELCPY